MGVPVVLGDKQEPNSVYMQVPGSGLKIKSEILVKIIEKSPELRRSLLHYTHAFFNQVAQSAACAPSSFVRSALLPMAIDDLRSYGLE